MIEKFIEVKAAELIPGDIIAKDVLSSTGTVLIKRDTDINEKVIERLMKSYNETLFVFRKYKNERMAISININQILIDEIEDIVSNTSKKFLKNNKNINQIKKVIQDILINDEVIKLMLPIRALGEDLFKHSINVALYSITVGREMHLPINKLIILGTAALLHDIGMLNVPKEILLKTSSLSENEINIIKKHPRHGFEVIQNTDKFNLEIPTIILQHHEKYDGTGYPNKLKNDKIHSMAKIINICDVFDAVTSERPYRSKFDKYESIELLMSDRDYYSNPDIIQALIKSISMYPYGQWIKLSTGEIGIVSEEEDDNKLNFRPSLVIYFDKDGNQLKTQTFVDLSLRDNFNIKIERLL
ncbi:MAG: HD domain-containing phosphohydrolase [Lutisporaceae bacterium]